MDKFEFLNLHKKQLTQLLAMIMSDGGISKGYNWYEIYFVQRYPEPCYCFKKLVKSLFKINVDVEQRKDGMFRVRIKNREIFDFIRSLIKGIKKDERIIPNFIMNEKELGKEFLRVMFGCEGSASYDRKRKCVKIEIACKSKRLKLQLQKMLRKYNISSRVYESSLQIRKKEFSY